MTIRRKSGTYITSSTVGEKFKAFVPAPLPIKPALDLSGLQPLIDKAHLSLGKLDAVVSVLPDVNLLLYFYVRKEALLSSQIEGTQSSFDDVLLYENDEKPKTPIDDVEEVSNYVAALQYGLKQIKKGMPISLRLMKETHAILLRGGRGSKKQPGDFRRSQNWIGGTRPGNAAFVPPPPEKVMECMGNLELFLNDQYGKTSALLKAAISHVQFETIHPFLDGNGRLGRLLITLILCSEGLISQPILYFSLHFKKHRKTYYDLLNSVRLDGRWEVWVEFFLDAVIETAEEAIKSTARIGKLFAKDIAQIETLGRAKPTALKVFAYLQKKPICSIQVATEALSLTQPSVTNALLNLQKLGIVIEISGRKRSRVFVYEKYLEILKEGT